jgi:Flp pilus assembly protein TadG
MSLRKTRSAQGGVAAVEFVVALPVLLFMMLGVAEFGRAFLQYNILTRTAQDTARMVASEALRGQAGTVNLDATLVTAARNVAVFGNAGGTGSALLPGLTPGNVTIRNLGGGNFAVAIAYAYQPMIGIAVPDVVQGGSLGTRFTLTAEVVMKAIS